MLKSRKPQNEDLVYTDPHAQEAPVALPRQRMLRVLGAWLAAAVLMVVASSALGFTIQGQGEQYQRALSLLEQREYDAAAAELENLGDFRDSAQLLAQLRAQESAYCSALELMAQTTVLGWEEAGAILEELGEYKDAQDLADACYLSAAKVRLTGGDDTAALAYAEHMSQEAAAAFLEEYQSSKKP